MHHRHRIALAAATLLMSLSAAPGRAAVTVTGPWFSQPGMAGPLDGPSLLLPQVQMWFATGAAGSFSATAGSQVQLASFSIAGGGAQGTGLLDGAGTVMSLHASGGYHRFEVGNSGAGEFTVSGGALLDGRVDAAACTFCGTWIGNAAGSSGLFTVTGAGSEARLLGAFNMGNLNVNGGFGVAGGQTTASVRVEQGGLLRSQSLFAGTSWLGPNSNGQERSVASVLVQGAGSRWLVEANTVTGEGATADFASGPLATATLAVTAGGRFEVAGSAGQGYGLRLGRGGTFTGEVTGVGSVLAISGDAGQGYLHVGEGGQAEVTVQAGGTLVGGLWNQVGMNGGTGWLGVVGAGSRGQFDRGSLHVGNAGVGSLLVADGGAVSARTLNVGSSRTGEGAVVIHGAGSVLRLDGMDGHRLAVGDWGDAGLTVRDGALLDGMQNAAACAGRWCGAIIGHGAGSNAAFTVSGAGSEARLLGQMVVGATQRNAVATDGWDFGTPGGVTTALVVVEAGGKLVNEWVDLGGWQPRAANLNEQSFADVVVRGTGSTWRLQGSALGGNDAVLAMGTQQRSTTTLTVSQGGLVQLNAPDTRSAGLYLSTGQGRSHVLLRDSGSRLELMGVNANVSVGASGGGNATLVVQDGAALVQDGSGWSQLNVGETLSTGAMEILSGGQVSGARAVNIGSGGTGSLLIDGAGSLLRTDRRGSFVGQLNIGTSGSGRLDVRNSGGASVFALQLGNGFVHEGNTASAVIDGAGSKVEADAVDWHRLGLENGSLTVSGGAVLDAAGNAAGCKNHWCGAFMVNNAGGSASFTVTGAGSRASFLSNFIVAGSYVTAPPATPYTLGEPGSLSSADIRVLAGGLLETEQVNLGYGPQGQAATGSEAALVNVLLDGSGSTWRVRGANGGENTASFATGVVGGSNALVNLSIRNGALLELVARDDRASLLRIGAEGGQSSLSITGNDAVLSFAGGISRQMQVGRLAAQGTLNLSAGGRIEGVSNLQIGLNGGVGTATVAGTGSAIHFGGTQATLVVGNTGGQGSASVTNGGQVTLQAPQIAQLVVGTGTSGQGSSGSLRLSGTGTRMELASGSLADATSLNPAVTIGSGNSGQVLVNAGAVLQVQGQAASTGTRPTYSQITVGLGLGGAGSLTLTGSGSVVSTGGVDALMTVGRSHGQGSVIVRDNALLSGTILGVGSNGGNGSLTVDHARISLAGQWQSTGDGANLAVGYTLGSQGLVRLTNGSQVEIRNDGGSDGASLAVGGAPDFAFGSGALDVSGGSSVLVTSSSGLARAVIGHSGTGIASFSGASSLDVGSGNVIVGLEAGSIGSLRLSGASTLSAGFVGVGASSSGDGGQGWLTVTDGSVLTATTLEIGRQGIVSGSGTLNAAIINRGLLRPGDSPGTLTVNGSFANQAGGVLELEIEADGSGGFRTDRLVFAGAAAPDLSGLKIQFHFVGATDPNAFQASGAFLIDNFLRQGDAPLDAGLLASTSYSASSDAYQFTSFTFSATGGAAFQAVPTPVPEPGSWALLALGLGLGAWLRSRRTRA